MGVRLVRYDRLNHANNNGLYDHDELMNRDLLNQHPIYAITGLQEVLNILEDEIYETNQLILAKDKATNIRIDNLILDIEQIQQDITSIRNTIANLNVIKGVEDTYSIDLDYNTTTKILKANVKIYEAKDDTNAIVETSTGLYVPKTITEDTNTVTWVAETRGESLDEIFNNGLVFSHSGSWNNVANTTEANAWYWDNALQSFVQPQNTGSFTGFVTQNFYDNYTHTATLKSTDSDNDLNGLIIGFVFDENGNPHTLSAVCDASGTIARWGVVYDYRLPDQQVIFSSGNGTGGTIPSNRPSGWSSQTNGITINVTKYGNLITCTCSNWGTDVLNEATKITFDLNNYSWGHLFKGQVRYGYCNYSQAYSYFTNITFMSKNTASSTILFASVKVSNAANNDLSVKDDGLYVPKFIISTDANNALVKKSNGYYVPTTRVSTQAGNALQQLSDGTFYVRDFSNIKSVNKSSHGFVVGDFIYYHPSNGYKKALAVDDYDSNIVGMVTKVIDTNNFEYMSSGYIQTTVFSTANGYTQGMPLYISDTDPGKVTQEQPDISKAVGYPVENTGLIISIERGIQYNQEAKFGDFKVSANTYNVRSDGFIRVIEGVDYKQSLVQNLINSLEDSFKSQYLVLDNVNQTVRFINVNDLYISNKVPDGLTLFIKAF